MSTGRREKSDPLDDVMAVIQSAKARGAGPEGMEAFMEEALDDLPDRLDALWDRTAHRA